MMKLFIPVPLTLFLIVFRYCYVDAQPTYPADFAQVLVAGGISNPTAMSFAPDGRIFVAEQAGRLRVIKNGALLPTPFIQLTVSSTGERGLIGIALDPNFSTTNHIFLYYTVPGSPVHNRVSRFTANGDIVQVGSELIILELDPLSTATNHNGGAMHFGKDGKLYIAVGENANSAHAQNLNTYHGKLLRINSDGSVPDGNPFTTGSEQQRRVWAYGLRNPYTFSIHPVTGRVLVNDVGQLNWEEINDATVGGQNFGWPTTEGNFDPAIHPTLSNPVYAYAHGSGDGVGCAITGGTFFFPEQTNYPSTYFGRFFFQDLCNRWINILDVNGVNTRASFATNIQGNSLALTVGNDGNLYYLSRTSSGLYKIIYNETTSPYITSHPESVTLAEGQSASFSVSALGSTPFTYQWRKNEEDIPDATGSTLTITSVQPEDDGAYTVLISNSAGTATSNAAALNVIKNALPTAKILAPTVGTTYSAGTSVQFSGTASDEEDGVLPAESFSWQINFHHDTHKHDLPAIKGVTNGTFFIPNEGELSHTVWYRIILTVKDTKGLVGKDSIDILPNTSTVTLVTDPPGLSLILDGQTIGTPVEFTSVEGMLRSLDVFSPQTAANAEYEFVSWSHGGEPNQIFSTPANDVLLVANFAIILGTEEKIENMKEAVIYPNPSDSDHIYIKLLIDQSQAISIELVNSLSQCVGSFVQYARSGEQRIELKFGEQGDGIYSVIIKTRLYTVVKKLVIVNRR